MGEFYLIIVDDYSDDGIVDVVCVVVFVINCVDWLMVLIVKLLLVGWLGKVWV